MGSAHTDAELASATIEINGQRLTLASDLTDAARDILKRLETGH